MLIDPFTVAAQIVNFLILIWLLRRVLYGPITRAMAARESRIRQQLDEASRLREEAQAAGERYRQQLAAFEEERATRLAEARAELDTWRHTHTQAVRTEVEAMRRRWQQALQQEQQAFLAELRQRVGREVLAAARRALQGLADADLETSIVRSFLKRLHDLSEEHRRQLAAAARENGRRVHIRTAHPLPGDDRDRLQEALAVALGTDFTTTFETAPDLLAGVELRAGGLKIAWALDDYIASIEDTFRDAFGGGQRPVHGRH